MADVVATAEVFSNVADESYELVLSRAVSHSLVTVVVVVVVVGILLIATSAAVGKGQICDFGIQVVHVAVGQSVHMHGRVNNSEFFLIVQKMSHGSGIPP